MRSSEHSLIYPFLDAKGDVKDYRQAFPTLSRPARDDDAYAQNVVGFCFDTGSGVRKNRSKALYWYRLAAKGGSPEAVFNLALNYEEGVGLKRDIRHAFRLYQRGAAMGDAECQCNLGCLYAEAKQDPAEALHWWRKAARREDSKAQYNLGMAYLDGEGTRRSNRWAALWLRRAAANGHAKARRVLRRTALKQ
jgi:TPR repeat protein